jgi:outer membrane biosynthesis protein TonB
MRRDLKAGILCSALLHIGAVTLGQLLGSEYVPPSPLPNDPIPVFLIPALPDDIQEPVESPESIESPVAPVPIMQPELLQAPQPKDFTQPIQPPPQTNLAPSIFAVTIPNTPLYSATEQIFDASLLDSQPVPIVAPLSTYPSAMRKQGIRGEVVIRLVVDTEGRVRSPRVVESTQSSNGVPVSSWIEVPVVFSVR